MLYMLIELYTLFKISLFGVMKPHFQCSQLSVCYSTWCCMWNKDDKQDEMD